MFQTHDPALSLFRGEFSRNDILASKVRGKVPKFVSFGSGSRGTWTGKRYVPKWWKPAAVWYINVSIYHIELKAGI
jgi:hypothetical protein